MTKTKAIIFDFDGVIADTFEFHREHFKKYLGVTLTKEEYQNLHKDNVFNGKKLSENEKIISDNLVDYFQKIIKDHYDVKSFDGINEVLKKLSENYLLFIMTSSSEINIINFLKKEKTFECFTEILGVEAGKLKTEKLDLILKKYDLQKENVLFVTDTSGDVFEAKKVGINSIAVTWGFHTKEILAESSPKFYAEKTEEILEIVGNEFCVIRWTAPMTGNYRIETAFTGADTWVGTSTDPHVHKGIPELWAGAVNGQNRVRFGADASFAAGETLDLSVGWGANSNFEFDTTFVAATIRAVE